MRPPVHGLFNCITCLIIVKVQHIGQVVMIVLSKRPCKFLMDAIVHVCRQVQGPVDLHSQFLFMHVPIIQFDSLALCYHSLDFFAYLD